MKKQDRPLGDARETVLTAMHSNDNAWELGTQLCREFGTHWTEQIVYSLVQRELVIAKSGGKFELTRAGKKKAAELVQNQLAQDHWTR